MIRIQNLNSGTTVLEMEIPEGALAHRELMGDHYIRLQFSLDKPVYLRLGDYAQTSFGRFELTSPYTPKYNTTTGGYDYDLQLDAYYIKWKNKICRYMPQNAASETSFHLTASIDIHLQVIVSTINAIGAKDSNFRYETSPFTYALRNFDETKIRTAKYKEYNNTDIISALNDLAGIFDCEWWVEDNVIYFGRCEANGDTITFEVDRNVLEMRGSESKNEYATRIYAFGSTRNLPKDYRKDSSADITKNGIVQKRLMLPLATSPNGYIQDTDVKSETEAVEAVIMDDDIYPRTKCKVSKVETYTDKTTDEETGEEIEQTFYRLTDGSGFAFSTDYILEGETLHILFQSGKMNGMDFECQYNDEKKYYEVVVNEDYGRPLPDTSLHPEVGDDFVIYNWDATKIGGTGLIEDAEQELKEAIDKKLERMKVDPNTYTCKMDSYWYEDNCKATDSSMNHYQIGQKVSLVNASSFDKPRQSRIIGYEIKLDIEYDTPEYIVGEATIYKKGDSLQSQIDSITVNGNTYTGGTGGAGGSGIYIITSTSSIPASDSNVFSAARTRKQFADKLNDDTINALWTLLKGLNSKGNIEIGNFVSGFFGSGALIDSKGNAEVESLFSRSFISTPEFRFNKISVTEGENWCTNGFGTILDVDTEEQTITLKLEENEFASVKVGDICRGIYNDLADSFHSISSDGDECGFSTKKGYFTSYFTITEMVKYESGECVFKYRLRNSSTPHPCKFMKFAQYGSFTDETRQSSSYSTSIGHSYEEVLEGVNDWVIKDTNIVYRHGWLGSMRVSLRNGQTAQLQGNGLYVQDNVYFGNAIVQLDPITLSDLQQKLELYTVEFSDYTDVVTVDAVGNVIGGLYKVEKDGAGNITRKFDYRIHSAIYVKRGNDFITQAGNDEEAGEGTYKVYTQCDGCTCIVENSTIYITSIKDVKDGVAGTSDDTGFDYDAMRERKSILVTVTIDCEGIGIISRAFPVTIKHDSQPFIGADIENEFSSISWNTKEQKYIGLPISFKFKMWRNNEMLDVKGIALAGIDGKYWKATDVREDGVTCKQITIEGLPKDFATVTNVDITGSCEYAGISYERTLVHTINKSTDTNVYHLEPSESSVHVTYDDVKNKVLSASKVFCNVVCNSTEDTHYIVPFADFATYGLSLKYTTTDADGKTSTEAEYPTAGISVTTAMASIKFILHIVGGTDISEDVPIVGDGLDGDNSVRLTLDNENDTCLALEDGTVIASTLPVSHAALFDGDHQVTKAEHEAMGNTWQTLVCTHCTAEYGAYNADGWREIKVKTVTDITAQVVVPCRYTSHGVTIEHKAILTVKKDIGTDKYEIITNPASVSYNPNNDTFTPENVAVSVYKTTRETPRTLLEALPSGFSLMYSTDAGNTWTALPYGSAITKAMMNVDGVESIQIRLREAVTKNGSTTYVVRDLESVDIVGDGLDGKGIEHVFFCHNSETKPTLYNDSNIAAFQADDYCPYTNAAHSDRWTDEPTGVGATSKFEFYAMRKKVNGVWKAFGEVKLWNRYTVDGVSPYIIDLSNDQSLINCTDDGTVIGSYEPTEIMIFMGDKDYFDKFNIEVTPTNISYTRSGRVITPSAITADSATISVKATLKTNTSIYLTAVYKINKTYKGADGVIYSLIPSINVIKKDENGNYVDSSFSVQVKKTVGKNVTMLSTATHLNNEGLSLKYGTASGESSVSDPSNISSSTVCGKNNYCTLYLYQDSTVVDRERINCVKDGDKGDQGDKGDDAYNISISTLNIVAKKYNSKTYEIAISVKKGSTSISNGTGSDKFQCSSLGSGGYTSGGMQWGSEVSTTGYIYTYKLYYTGNDKTEEIPFTVTVGGVEYKYVIHFSTVSDGSSGDDGKDGFSLINRGVWNVNGYYPNNNGYSYRRVGNDIIRDEVIHIIGGVPYVFMVKNRTDLYGNNSPVTAEPSLNSSYWEVGSIYQLLFANCLFAENANIGGFIVNNMMLRSQSVSYRVVYKNVYNERKQYEYINSENTADGVPERAMVKYDGKFYVVLTLGSSVKNVIPTDTDYWREATAEESSFATEITNSMYNDAVAAGEVLYTDIYKIRFDGSTGTISMRQADDSIWTYDRSGKQIMGIEGGKRLELDPSNKDIRIYDSTGECVSIFEGNKYSQLSELYGTQQGDVSVNSHGSKTIPETLGLGNDTMTDTGTFIIAFFETSTPTEVSINMALKTRAYSAVRSSDNSSMARAAQRPDTNDRDFISMSMADAYINVRVKTYTDSTKTKLLENVLVGSLMSSASSDAYNPPRGETDIKSRRLNNKCNVVAGYHVVEVMYTQSACIEGSYAQCMWGNDALAAGAPVISYNSEFYVSRFFANGFTLGVRSDNLVAAFRDNNGMNFIAQNPNYGIKINSSGLQIKIGSTSSWKSLSISSDGTVKAT